MLSLRNAFEVPEVNRVAVKSSATEKKGVDFECRRLRILGRNHKSTTNAFFFIGSLVFMKFEEMPSISFNVLDLDLNFKSIVWTPSLYITFISHKSELFTISCCEMTLTLKLQNLRHPN